MRPVETIISTIERCQDAVVFSVDEARAKVAADEPDSVRQKGSLLIDQMSNAISSLLQKKTTILTTSLGKLNKDRLVSSQRTSKALQRGDWNKAHQDVDSAKATGSKTIQQSKPENVEGKDVKKPNGSARVTQSYMAADTRAGLRPKRIIIQLMTQMNA